MTHALDYQQKLPHKLTRFQKFVYVSDSTMKCQSALSSQLRDNPNSSWLQEAEIGSSMTIKQIHATQSVIQQLKGLEFKPEQRVQLISKTQNGSVIVDLHSTLIGLGQEIASRIIVTSVGVANNESGN